MTELKLRICILINKNEQALKTYKTLRGHIFDEYSSSLAHSYFLAAILPTLQLNLLFAVYLLRN